MSHHESNVTPCSHCDALITDEEFEQGYAVRIGGKPVCPDCIELLPAATKIRIEQARAARGLQAKTFRFRLPKHTNLNCFTFSTAVALSRHNHAHKLGQSFDAPLLGISKGTPAPQNAEPKGPPWGLIGGGIVAAALLVSVLTMSDGDAPQTDTVADTPSTNAFQRSDFPSQPVSAWQEAKLLLNNDNPLLLQIRTELETQIQDQLQSATRELDQGKWRSAQGRLQSLVIPTDLQFQHLQQEHSQLLRQCERQKQLLALAPSPEPKTSHVGTASTTPEETAKKNVETAIEPEKKQLPTTVISTASDDKPTVTTDNTMEPTPPMPEDMERYGFYVRDCFHRTIKPDHWELTSGKGLALRASMGSLGETIDVQGGSYRIWLQIRKAPSEGHISCMLGQQTQSLFDLDGLGGGKWVALNGDPISLPEGKTTFDLYARGEHWEITRCFIADARHPQPTKAIEDYPQPNWHFTPKTEDSSPQPSQQLLPVQVITNHRGYKPLETFNPKRRVSALMPGNMPKLIYPSHAQRGKGQMLTLDLSGHNATRGGIAFLINSRRSSRKFLNVTFFDTQGQRFIAPQLSCTNGDWNTSIIHFPVKFSEAARPKHLQGVPDGPDTGVFDPSQLHSAIISDDNDNISTPFIVGKVVSVSERAPSYEDLELLPRGLVIHDYDRLRTSIKHVLRKRRAKKWKEDFDPQRVKWILSDNFWYGNWTTQVRLDLVPFLGDPPPNKTLVEMKLADAWLNNEFIIPKGFFAEKDKHLVFIMTGGKEFHLGLTVNQSLTNLWKKLVTEAQKSGVLPIIVLGPAKCDEIYHPQLAKLNQQLFSWMKQRHPGLPVIDMRNNPPSSLKRFAQHQAQLTKHMLIDSYNEFLTTLDYLKK